MKPHFSLALALAVMALAWPASSQVPQMINYQGFLAASGEKFNGIGQFKFALVNGAGNVSFWSNDGTSGGGAAPATAVALGVTNGLFTVMLGDTAIPHMTVPIPGNIFTNPDVRLRIWFSPSGTGFQQLAPDQRLGSVASALQAGNAAVAQSVAPGVLSNVGTVTRVNTGAGLSGGPITNNGTISIPNGAISNSLLQNSTVTVVAGSGISGGGAVPLGGSTTVSVNASHDSTLTGNGGSIPLALNLANANTWSATQTFLRMISGDVSGTAERFRAALAGDVTGPQGATVVSNLLRWQSVPGTAQQARPNTGYILTGASQATVTLPTSPAPGDTVRLAAPGTGGWKLAQNAGQSIFGGSFGSLAVGVTWTPRASAANWSALAASADASKLAAVVNGGQIYISTDGGSTWGARDSNRAWFDVACSADGTHLAAVVNGGQIYTSTNLGAIWTPRETSRAWNGIASSSDGSKLVAVVNGGQIFTSSDAGSTWTPRASARAWRAVASSADGTKLLAVVYPGQISTSTDSGVNWSALHGPNSWWETAASSSDGATLAIAGRGSQIQVSTDSGETWTPRETVRNWVSLSMSGDGRRLAAVVNGGQIYLSTDFGVSWTARENNRAWSSVASSTDGTRLAAAVVNGQIYISIPPRITPATTTTPGVTGYLSGGQGTALELLYIGNNQFFPLSHEGEIWAF